MTEEFEMLGVNAGYFLGYDGRLEKYLRHPLRSIAGNQKVERQRLENLVEEIDGLDPDIVGLVEVDQGSLRTFTDFENGQVDYLKQRLSDKSKEYRSFAEFKYRSLSVLEKIPVIASMSNGALFKEGDVKDYHVHRGWKRLLIEIEYGDLSVFICHLPYPLFPRTQKRQLEEISEILDGKEKFVLYGDFNTDDLDRLQILEERNDAEVHSPGFTYPKCDPEEPFDIFITGPEVELEDMEILETEISDHKPVRANFLY